MVYRADFKARGMAPMCTDIFLVLWAIYCSSTEVSRKQEDNVIIMSKNQIDMCTLMGISSWLLLVFSVWSKYDTTVHLDVQGDVVLAVGDSLIPMEASIVAMPVRMNPIGI